MKNKKEKILFFIPRMGNGGAERVMATLANELVERDYKVRIVTLTSVQSFYYLNEKVEIIGANYKINKENFWKRNYDIASNGFSSIHFLNSMINSWHPDIVISFLTHTNIISSILRVFNSNFKLIVSERAEPRQRGIITRLSTKLLYPIADYIVCQSTIVAEFFPKYTKNKIKIIENPIDKDALPKVKAKKRKKVIVGVGRLFEQKNFSLLIDSFSDIRREYPEYILEIYGEGHLREDLESQIKQLNLEDKVFLMGIKKNVMKYIYDSALFVMPSNFEGFPNALIEAMASGLPVITTDFSTGVARELVSEDRGIIIPVGDKESLSNAIREILSNEEMIKTMSANNWKVREELALERIIEKWLQLF